MDEMKNLVIQALDAKGVLGQLRANLRASVFKIVDDQDQKFNTGCGFKWENKLLYKASETKIGVLIAEIMREFMEHLRMDYSLSVFIPEFSIPPERLKKEEIFAKLGLDSSFLKNFNDLPTIYLIIQFFIESIFRNPESVLDFLNRTKENEVETKADELIDNNLRNYYKQFNNNDENYNQNNDDVNYIEDYDNYNQEPLRKEEEHRLEEHPNRFEAVDEPKVNKYNEFNQNRSRGLTLENFESRYSDNKPNKSEETKTNTTEAKKTVTPEERIPEKNNDAGTIEQEISEIDEEIMLEDDSFDKSDKKNSNNTYNISQSGGYDGTVDSAALEKYNYIEPVDK